jgi:hypothetical protein
MHRITISAAVLVGCLMAPSAASADLYLSKAQASRAAKYEAERMYGGYGVRTSCRPFGQSRADSRYDYRKWVCGWAGLYDNDDGTTLLCSGVINIAGCRVYQYQYKVIRGERCEEYLG